MKTIITTVLLILSAALHAQMGWTERDSLQPPRYFLSSFVIGDYAYAGWGSINAEQRIYSDQVFRYDPATDNWTQMAPFPGGGRYAATAFAVNGKGYLCLGVGNDLMWRDDVWEFDPATGQWSQKGNFPGGPRYHCASFVIDNKAYICGGSVNQGYNYLNDLWCYDPATDTWERKADLPTEHKAGGVGFSVGGYGYVGCGAYSTDQPTQDFYMYDPVADSWWRFADFPYPRTGAICFVIGQKAYMGCGTDLTTTHKDIWSCDFSSTMLTWVLEETLPEEFTERTAGTAFAIGEAGYLLAGRSEPYDPYYSSGKMLCDMWSFRDCVLPVAEFGFTAYYPEVYFSDSSTAGASAIRLWSFGDSTFSTEVNPVHTYANPGVYDVCLSLSDSCGTHTMCHTVGVYLPMTLQVTITPSTVNQRVVQFHDATPGTTRWRWDFGDGNFASERSPSHIYSDDGIYRVCLTAGNDLYEGTFCDTLALSIDPLSQPGSLCELFPNPAEGRVWLRFSKAVDAVDVMITDLTGRQVAKATIRDLAPGNPAPIELGSLPAGLYLLQLQADGEKQNAKLVLR